MKNSKALEVVWKLREEVAKNFSPSHGKNALIILNETAHKACKRLGIKCHTTASRLNRLITKR